MVTASAYLDAAECSLECVDPKSRCASICHIHVNIKRMIPRSSIALQTTLPHISSNSVIEIDMIRNSE